MPATLLNESAIELQSSETRLWSYEVADVVVWRIDRVGCIPSSIRPSSH